MKRIRIALIMGFLALAALAAPAQVVMRGDVHYWISNSRVRVDVEDITNFGDQTTDRLRFVVWASEDPWEYYDRGRVLAVVALPRLGAHRNFDDVGRTMRVHRPPTGWYYVTLGLMERKVDENGQVRWVVRDKVEFRGQHYFSRSWFPDFPF